jgi:hypothetical protein
MYRGHTESQMPGSGPIPDEGTNGGDDIGRPAALGGRRDETGKTKRCNRASEIERTRSRGSSRSATKEKAPEHEIPCQKCAPSAVSICQYWSTVRRTTNSVYISSSGRWSCDSSKPTERNETTKHKRPQIVRICRYWAGRTTNEMAASQLGEEINVRCASVMMS